MQPSFRVRELDGIGAVAVLAAAVVLGLVGFYLALHPGLVDQVAAGLEESRDAPDQIVLFRR